MKRAGQWLCAVGAIVAVIGIGIYLLQSAMTLEECLERHGYCDVIYYAYEDGISIQRTHFLGATPILGIGVIWHDDVPALTLGEDTDPGVITWLSEVVGAAVDDENPWRIIEIDVLYEKHGQLEFAGTIFITRAMRLDDGSKQYLDELKPKKAVRKWMKAGHIFVVNTLSYPRKYLRGYNCEGK